MSNERLGIFEELQERRRKYLRPKVAEFFFPPTPRPKRKLHINPVSLKNLRTPPVKRIDLSLSNAIAQAVCEVWKIRPEGLVGTARYQNLVRARFAFVRLVYKLNRPIPSSTQIGYFLRRDHSTVLSARERAAELHGSDASWRALYEQAKALLVNA